MSDSVDLLNDVLKELTGRNAVPPILYQYTDISALQGIIDYSELWATECHYLNDENEFVYGINFVKDFIQKNKSNYPNLQNFFQKLEKYNLTDTRFYAALSSFSKQGDLLSQWRGYGKGYTSVSIGFDTTKLLYFGNGSDDLIFFQKVLYEQNDQEDFVKKALKLLNDKYSTNSFAEQIVPLLFSVFFFKEFCWKEEEEWRLIHFTMDPKQFNFKGGGCGMIPYIPLKIFTSDVQDCISNVIIPKSRYYEKQKKAIEMKYPSLVGKISPSSISIDYGFSMTAR